MIRPQHLIVAICIASPVLFASAQLSEQKRLEEYAARGYEWPPKEVVPNTQGWMDLFTRRFKQVENIPVDGHGRYDGWVQSIGAALVAPNFTENGWGLARAPEGLLAELKEKLHAGLPTAPYEKDVDVIEGEDNSRPLFIENEELNEKVLRELKPYHEYWSGYALEGAIAYGLRAYQNHSRLLMHVDKSRTHVISSILHIDHSEDSEPWPIIIEDFQGNTNEVVLESGDMLFYESSKCFHGRPHYFKGSWYSSIFTHYYPVGWDSKTRHLENHYAVPPHWHVQLEDDELHDVDELNMVGTSLKEPGCEHVWCALKDSVKWYGPAIEGKVITTGKPMGEEVYGRPIKERWDGVGFEYDEDGGVVAEEEEEEYEVEEEYEEEYVAEDGEEL